MFRTLNYLWKQFRKRPSRRGFLIFVKMLRTEIKCLMMTGYSTDELIKQSGGGMVDAKYRVANCMSIAPHREGGTYEQVRFLS